MLRVMRAGLGLVLVSALLSGSAGCNLSGDDIEDIIEALGDAIDLDGLSVGFASPPPAFVAGTGQTVVIDNSVTIIDDPGSEIIIAELPDILLISFENFTGVDIFVQYAVDGEFQGIFLRNGETILLEYPCVFDIELLQEDDIDPFSGALIESIPLSTFVEEGFDYFCGDAVIFTFTPTTVDTFIEPF